MNRRRKWGQISRWRGRLTFIVRWTTNNGEHRARVFETSTKRRLATACGTKRYSEGASKLFASSWEIARRDLASEGGAL